jgi:hypothetical protein
MHALGTILLAPFRAIAGLGTWFARASLAARLALVIGIFQVAIVVLATAAVLFAGEWAVLQLWWSPGKVLALLLLLITVPWLVYQTARLWLSPRSARWPEIGTAWRAIREDLERQGISLGEVPLFLVLGTDGASREGALFAELRPAAILAGSPGSGGPLHAYASPEAVFLCLNGVGAMAVATAAADGGPAAATAGDRRHDAVDRLETLCDLLASDRAPLVAINGVLVVVPLDLPRPAAAATERLAEAAAEDIGVMVREFGVRMPVTLLATGLEDDPVVTDLFALLAQRQPVRVGADRIVSQSSGREEARGAPFPPGLAPEPEHLVALVTHAFAPIVDQIAELLLEPARIGEQPLNRRLLACLVRLRMRGAAQLRVVLERVFSRETAAAGLPMLAGCYVAALSADPARRGFLSGVLTRVVEQQAELEWTDARWRADARASRAAVALFGLAIACFVATAVLLWWKFDR